MNLEHIGIAMVAAMKAELNLSRVFEALLIAGVTAGVTLYAAEKVVENQIATLKETDTQTRLDLRELKGKVDIMVIEIARLTEKLDQHDRRMKDEKARR